MTSLSPADQIAAAQAVVTANVSRSILLGFVAPVRAHLPAPSANAGLLEQLISDVQGLGALPPPVGGTPWLEVWLRAAATLARATHPAEATELERLADAVPSAPPPEPIAPATAPATVESRHLAAIVDLLKSTFNPGELRRFITFLSGAGSLADEVDWNQSLSQLVFDVVIALNDRGLYTTAFWEAWLAARPGRGTEIRARPAQVR